MEIIHEFSIIHGNHAIIIEWFSIITNQWPKSAMDVQNCWAIEPKKLFSQIFPHLFALNFFFCSFRALMKISFKQNMKSNNLFSFNVLLKIPSRDVLFISEKMPSGIYSKKFQDTWFLARNYFSFWLMSASASEERVKGVFLLQREYFYKVGVTPRLVSRSLKWVDNWKLGRMVKFNFLPNFECSRCNFPIFSSTEAFLRIITF